MVFNQLLLVLGNKHRHRISGRHENLNFILSIFTMCSRSVVHSNKNLIPGEVTKTLRTNKTDKGYTHTKRTWRKCIHKTVWFWIPFSKHLTLIPVLLKSIVNIVIDLSQSRILPLSSTRSFTLTLCITLSKSINLPALLTHVTRLNNTFKIHLLVWTGAQKTYAMYFKYHFNTHIEHTMKIIYTVILSLHYFSPEFITGNLTIAQIEDSRFIRHGSSSSTGAVTRISFCLHDPSDYFKSASFVYNWDFGDG